MSHLTELSPFQRFVRDLFHPEDDLLAHIQAEIEARGKPSMNIGPEQGRMLQVLMASVGASRVLEVGTFFGYSAVWLGRGLPPAGRLICLEASAEHAEIAQRFLQQAALGDRVEVRVGQALALLPGVVQEGPFDLIFLDADTANYPAYLDWAERLLRPAGILVVDNAYLYGQLLKADLAGDPQFGPAYRGLHETLRRLAAGEQWVSTVMPYEDGLAVAVYRP